MSVRQTNLHLVGLCKAVEYSGVDEARPAKAVKEMTRFHVEGEGWGASLTLTPAGDKVAAQLHVSVVID